VSEWLQDLEALEAISRDPDACEILLRMAALAHEGRTGTFLDELHSDGDLDRDTKGALAELASDASFLFALEDYLTRTARVH